MIDRRLFTLGAGALGLAALASRPARASLEPMDMGAFWGAALPGQFALGARLLQRLDRGAAPPASLLVSPLGAVAALALVSTGADAGLSASIARLAGVPAGKVPAETGRALTALALESLRPAGPLTSAGRLVLDPGIQPSAPLVKALVAQGLPVTVQDLADPAVVEALNAWVKEATRGLIPSILEEAPGHGGLVSLNALHFKDRWRAPFDARETQPAPFAGLLGKTRDVPMMTRSGVVRMRTEPKSGMVAVDLPFADPRFRLALATHPEPRRAERLLLDGAPLLTGRGFALREIDLALPKLDLSASDDLLGPLKDLGLAGGLGPGALAPFGAVTPSIRSIAQKAVLSLDEQGAEAAAATAVVATRGLVERPGVSIRFDRPFLFALRDVTRGFVVMTGWVDLAPG